MRALLLCTALLSAALAPTASAHDNPPPGISIDPNLCSDTLLPVFDFVECLMEHLPSGVPWFVPAYAEYFAHMVGCHVVGGPACVV